DAEEMHKPYDVLGFGIVGQCFYMAETRGTNCGIIDWYDPPMCDRAVQIIPGLLRRINHLQQTLADYQAPNVDQIVDYQGGKNDEASCDQNHVKLEFLNNSKSSPRQSKNHNLTLLCLTNHPPPLNSAYAKGYIPLFGSTPTAVKICPGYGPDKKQPSSPKRSLFTA
ncbi:hypothetical protein Tco_0765217, partial [Tanacetum coccineum]